MCAIAGYLSFKFSPGLKEKVFKMLALMQHRGPDNTSALVFDDARSDTSIALGHNRLSIIDLSENAHQPMSNEDATVWITYNGEIYNFKELRQDLEKRGHTFKSVSDTEVILHLYEDLGENCLEQLEGMFAFCIYDKARERFFLARDRFGKKPLYYYSDSRKFIFASEIKAFSALEELEKNIEARALEAYFSVAYVPGPCTIYEKIYKLLPGHFMFVDKNGLAADRYWDFEFGGRRKSDTDYIDEFSFLMEKAVRQRLISDVPLGAFLSGGIDSSVLVGLMSKLMREPVKTYTVGFEEKAHNELEYAKSISDYFHTKHHSILLKGCSPELLQKVVWHLDEPLADGATVPTYLLAEFAKEGVTVVLSGEGADETLGGYPYYYYEQWIKYYSFLPQYLKEAILPFLLSSAARISGIGKLAKIASYGRGEIEQSIYRWRVLFNESQMQSLFRQELLEKIKLGSTKGRFMELFDHCQAKNIIDKALYIDSSIYLPDDLLMKIDKLTMAHALEARTPYLDYGLLKFISALPVKIKVRGMTGKYILKKYASRLVPDRIIKRPKHGFTVPVDRWLKEGLKSIADDSFCYGGILDKTGLFNIGFIQGLWKRSLAQGFDARSERQLWALLNFAVWWKQNRVESGAIRLRECTGVQGKELASQAKIVLLALDFPPSVGGIQTTTHNICLSLKNDAFFVLAPYHSESAGFDRLQLFKIIRPGIKSAQKAKKINKLFYLSWCIFALFRIKIHAQIKVVLCNHIWCGLPAFLFYKLFKVPYVVFTHALEIMDEGRRWLDTIILRNASYVVYHSEFTKRRVITLGVKEYKIKKIPPPVNLNIITDHRPSVSEKDELRRRLGMTGQRLILTVARLNHYKGVDKVIEALPQVHKNFSEVKYIVIGIGEDAGYLKEKASVLGVRDKVVFLGELKKNELLKYFDLCDLFILASRELRIKRKVFAEGFGLVFLEAAAFGKPVIGGNSGGIPDAVVDGVTGLLVDPEDPAKIAQAIVRLFKDEKLAKELGENGRRRVEQEFSLCVLTNKMADLIYPCRHNFAQP